MLKFGESAPLFVASTTQNPRYSFASLGGIYIVLCFFGSARDPFAADVLSGFHKHAAVFDRKDAGFFGISTDPEDLKNARVKDVGLQMQYFWDFQKKVSQGYKAVMPDGTQKPYTLILDYTLRVVDSFAFSESKTPEEHVERVMSTLAALPKKSGPQSSIKNMVAPVLSVPRVFEPAFCDQLIQYYNTHEHVDSGFMRDIDGKTVGIMDYSVKKREDCMVEDNDLRKEIRDRINTRLLPSIKKAFCYSATVIERYMVGCYEAESGGHFRAHRDNTTRATAHRRFAVTINLNPDEYEGGNLRFPEFGPHEYRADKGGAVVFSCSLLHEAMPVTRGKRYAFLPFLFDEEANKIREANVKFLDQERILHEKGGRAVNS